MQTDLSCVVSILGWKYSSVKFSKSEAVCFSPRIQFSFVHFETKVVPEELCVCVYIALLCMFAHTFTLLVRSMEEDLF